MCLRIIFSSLNSVFEQRKSLFYRRCNAVIKVVSSL